MTPVFRFPERSIFHGVAQKKTALQESGFFFDALRCAIRVPA
jgi:hypothetical protein